MKFLPLRFIAVIFASVIVLTSCSKVADVDEAVKVVSNGAAENAGKLDIPGEGTLPVRICYVTSGCFHHEVYRTEDPDVIRKIDGAVRGIELADGQGGASTTVERIIYSFEDGTSFSLEFSADSVILQTDPRPFTDSRADEDDRYEVYCRAAGLDALREVIYEYMIGE